MSFRLILILSLLLILPALYGVKLISDHASKKHTQKAIIDLDGLKKCLSLEKGRDLCYAELCEYEPGYLCAEDILEAAVLATNPEKATMALHDIMESLVFTISETDNGHLLMHKIGESLAKNFGSTGENFLRCPYDFNTGCLHGFFEVSVINSEDPSEIASRLCENLPAFASPKDKGQCYHGAGHSFMMHESQNLNKALQLCKSVPPNRVIGCAGGVFMENAGDRDWESKQKNFKKDDPLYPCTVVEDQFKHDCYVYQNGYLIRHYSNSWGALVEVCMNAKDFTGACIAGLGLLIGTNPWIDFINVDFNADVNFTEKSYEEKVVLLCEKIKDTYVENCYALAIIGILNEDVKGSGNRFNTERVFRLCSSATKSHRQSCYKHTGGYLSHLGANKKQKDEICKIVPNEYQSTCLNSSFQLD